VDILVESVHREINYHSGTNYDVIMTGFKQIYQRVGPPPPFFAASCELALGLIPIMDKETYATITEEEIVAILKEQELTEEEFSALVDRLSSYNETKS
jgi:hypothetical protein